ncbi:hypothetical protein HSR6_0226 [Halodesulfurarchaeum formicicum]|uniref:Cell surface glycoprotein n=1 Tax=Halodesulfurarchaeum formicicum TaxID=1873524 RepID=A0A1J1A993_9EURY|nr:hypothetical protein HSR6_0226 [Halodesulfurarchaeum formicicum]
MPSKITSRKVLVIILLIVITSGGLPGATAMKLDGSSTQTISENGSANEGGGLYIEIASEDELLRPPDESVKRVQPLNGTTQYRYLNDGINDGNDSTGYQVGDDIVKLEYISEPTDPIRNDDVFTFPKDLLYIKNASTNGDSARFESGDDIYTYSTLKGEPALANESINYKTPRKNIRFLNNSTTEKFSGDCAIIESSNPELDVGDEAKSEGSCFEAIALNESDLRYWEDDDFSPGYTASSNGEYGEPIYRSSDNTVDPDADERFTKATVYTGTDSNVSTLDLGLGTKTLVESTDEDTGAELENPSFTPTVNEVDPDGSNIGSFDKEDIFIIDLSNDSYYDSNRDILINGEIPNGTKYDQADVEGTWKAGRTYTSKNLVIFDTNNDGDRSNNLLFSADGLKVGSQARYLETEGSIRYFDTTPENSRFEKGRDGLYVDIGNDGVSVDQNVDLRLAHLKTTYSRNSTVKGHDLDSNLTISNFGREHRVLDESGDGKPTPGEPIISSNDENLGPNDEIIVNGTNDVLSPMGMSNSNIVLIQGEDNYQAGTPVIRLESGYSELSKGYTTNNISYDEIITLNSFTSGTGSLVVHQSPEGDLSDRSQILWLNRTQLSVQKSLSPGQKLELRNFSKSVGALIKEDRIRPSSGIYREHDQDVAGTTTYGDQLQTITVENTGSLDPTYIDQITLQTDGTEVAAASSPTTNGTWVLQPAEADATIDPSGTAFTLQTTLSEDAPGGETVSLRVPEPVDADDDGAYDPGDAGLFFEQDVPTGGFGPGPTLTVESESDSSSEPTTSGPSPIDLSVTPPASNLSANATTLPVEVSGNATDRSVQATLQYAANNSTVASQTGSLDRNGETEFDFEPIPGRYRVRVEALESDGVAHSAVLVVEEPPGATLEALDHAITRDERVRVNLTLERTDTATVSLRGPDGDRLERASVTTRNTTVQFALSADGTGTENRSATVALESTDASQAGLAWLTTVADNETEPDRSTTDKSVPGNASTNPPAHARSGAGNGTHRKPLEAGNYTISVAIGDTVRDSDTVQIGANWTAAIEPMVAPRGATIASAEDVAKNASRREKIATGDRLVIAVDTAGLGSYARNITPGRAVGHANANGPPGRGGGPIGRNKTSKSSANGTPPAFVSVGPKSGETQSDDPVAGLRRVEAPNSDRFFVVADPNASDRVTPGTALETAVVLTENTPFVPNRTNETEQERRRAAVEVVEARAELGRATENETLDLPTNATVPINGSTTVAPGTTATVHIEGTERNFSVERETTVQENGTYETTANLSEYDSGTNYTVTVTANDEQISEVYTGQFTGTESTTFAAAGGGGGGSAAEPRHRSTPAETTTPPTDSVTSPLSDLPGEPVDRVVEAVPEPLQIGQSALLILAFGTLALLMIGVGLKRLIRP